MADVASLTRRAAAKVNLYLRIVGRRADGYHLLDSLVVFVDLADQLRFAPAPTIGCRVYGAFARGLDGSENLAARAARLLLAEAPPQEAGCAYPGVAIDIEKNIPVAAGLGGGSADAAATLDALNQMWRLGLDETTLTALALRLGADVPMCRFGRPALVSGVGETIRPAPVLPAFALLLVNPNRPVATADVFGRLAPPYGEARPLDFPTHSAAELAQALRQRGNDLAAPAIALCPPIGEALALLERLDGCLLAQMSGSGATCYGLFADIEDAQAAARRLQPQRPHWFVRVCTV